MSKFKFKMKAIFWHDEDSTEITITIYVPKDEYDIANQNIYRFWSEFASCEKTIDAYMTALRKQKPIRRIDIMRL